MSVVGEDCEMWVRCNDGQGVEHGIDCPKSEDATAEKKFLEMIMLIEFEWSQSVMFP